MYYRFWPTDTPHISAMILTSLIIVMDVSLLIIVLLRKLGLTIGPGKNVGLYALLIFAVMMIITYIVVVRPKTYKQMNEDFDSRDKMEKRKLVTWSILFNLTTFFFTPVTFIINAIWD